MKRNASHQSFVSCAGIHWVQDARQIILIDDQ